MRIFYVITASAFLALASPLAAEQAVHRQLEAHVHGQGSLNIAIDGNKLDMELKAPGADIVGFEHAAESTAQKAAVEQAKVALAEFLNLFKLPGNANCKVDKADVAVRTEEHHHHDDEHADAGKKAADGAKDEDHDEHDGHSGFHARYLLTCAAPANLTALETTYFKAFAGAQALNVSVVTPKGQSQMQLTRDKTILALAGLM